MTPEQIDRIRYWGYKVIDPISKTLMCGEKESKETKVFEIKNKKQLILFRNLIHIFAL